MDTTNIQNNNTATDNNETAEEKEAQLKAIGDEMARDREEFKNNTQAIIEKIENEPEISDDDGEDEQGIAKVEEELGSELDEAMIDLATKEGEEPEA